MRKKLALFVDISCRGRSEAIVQAGEIPLLPSNSQADDPASSRTPFTSLPTNFFLPKIQVQE